jgi:hypothetical protein
MAGRVEGRKEWKEGRKGRRKEWKEGRKERKGKEERVHSKHDISIARGGLFQNAGKEGREEGRKDHHLAFVQHTARRDPPVYHITNHCI